MNLTDELNTILTNDIKNYALSLFVDTRVKQNLNKQYFTEPLGYSRATKFIHDYGDNFVAAVNKVSFKVALQMRRYTDPNYRLALWADYLING